MCMCIGEVDALRIGLLGRYLHARANAFRKEVGQALESHKKDLAIRSSLKVSMTGVRAGRGKSGGVRFDSAYLKADGHLSAAALHELLYKVADGNPDQLDGISKAEMAALIAAYAPTHAATASMKKAPLRIELVGCILSMDGFARPDPKLMKI
jgi:hypothetical protein